MDRNIAIENERTQIHFLSDVLIAVASLDLKVPNICDIGAALLKPNINQFLNDSTYRLRKEKRYFMTWTTDSGKELRTFDNSLIPSSTELDTKETRIQGRFVLIRSHVIILYYKLHF